MKSTKSAIINLTETLSIQTYIAEDGNHYVTAIDVNALLGFQSGQMGAGKTIQRILGKDASLGKIKPQDFKNNVTGILLDTFNQMLVVTAKGGNQVALDIVLALSGTTLQLLSDDAHGIAVTNETLRVTYEARAFGKETRKNLTARLQELGYESKDYAIVTLNVYAKLEMLDSYDDYKATGGKKFRDTLNERELVRLERLEDWVVRKVQQGMQPLDAIRLY